MPQIMLRQPNGLYANFSTIVDDFTVYDADIEELRGWARESWGTTSELQIEQMIERAKADAPSATSEAARPDGLGRWLEAMSSIYLRHGKERFQEALAETAGDHPYPQAELEAITVQIDRELADRAD